MSTGLIKPKFLKPGKSKNALLNNNKNYYLMKSSKYQSYDSVFTSKLL